MGFNTWDEADSWTAPAEVTDPVGQGILDAAEARRAVARMAQEEHNRRVQEEMAAANAAATRAFQAEIATRPPPVWASVDEDPSVIAARARLAQALSEDAILKATPGYTTGGVVSTIIDWDTPGANPGGGYFQGRDPTTVTDENTRGRGPVVIPPPEGAMSGFNNFNVPPVNTSGVWDVIKGGLGGIGGGIPGILEGVLWGLGGGGGDPRGSGLTTNCPSGYRKNASGGCDKEGFLTGTIPRLVPGGQTGTYTPPGTAGSNTGVVWSATMDEFQNPAVTPILVQRNTRACPPGAVLGKNGLCYRKGSIPRQFREWAPPPKPLLSAGDGKILRRAMSLEKKLNRVAGKYLAPPRTVRKKKGRGRK